MTLYSDTVAYSRDDIDTIREKTDLVELAAEVTKVRRSGRSTMAVCPFHSEKTPSLSIDSARGLYHCFGCGKSGDVYRWVQETQGLDFTGAVEFLARRAGVTLRVDPEAAKRRSQRESLIDATAAAVDFYTERLKSAPDAGTARSYLRSRGYDGDVVDKFSLGYSPDEWEALVGHLRDLGIRDDSMVKAGLASRSRRNTLVDRFRGRVMFPIFDVRGDAVGFGARILEGDGPKYLNSSESPIYHKSRLLYGLNWAKSDIVRADTSVVVEGYTDVIAMHLGGMPIAVATCGTALGEDHLDLLRRFSERVVFAFDADEAGAGAALRSFDRSVPGDLDLRVATLPEGKDPADVVADGNTDELRTAVDASVPLLQFRIDSELAKFDLSEPEARARAVRGAAAVIALHPDPVTRHEYAVMVTRRTGVDVPYVEQAMRMAKRTLSKDQGVASSPSDEDVQGQAPLRSPLYRTELELIRVMLANDARLADVEIDADLFVSDETAVLYRRILDIAAGVRPGDLLELGAAIGSDDSAEAREMRELALVERPLADPAELVARLEIGKIDAEIDVLRRNLQIVDEDADAEGHSELWRRLIALEQEKRNRRSDR
ncbi:MAG: DNA primase [Acidimicrobiia bacterium]|nr:MAG: DNA primase [Acidimicrobiia bacterium]